MRTLLRKCTVLFTSFSLSFATAVGLHFANLTALAQDAEITESVGAPAGTRAETFTDVHEGNHHYLPILELAKEGVINGYDDGTFHPYATINRAEALKIILETFGDFEETEGQYETPEERPFEDVPLSSWFAKYIAMAKDKNIVGGYEDLTFRPEGTINLAEALKMIEESLKNYIPVQPPEDPFADVSLSDWFAEYVQYAKNREMVNISDSNRIFPGQEMTRGYFAEIIYKLKHFGEELHFGKATFYGAAAHGGGTASGRTFNMYEMTAAHKTLPFGTIVEVTNLANNESVQVEITDRGPYGPGRVIDLTSSAFAEIAELHQGVINVQYKVVSEPAN